MENTSSHTNAERLSGLARLYERISSGVLIALTFLLPLVVLPVTMEPREVNKQTLLVIFIFVAALAYLGQVITRKQMTLRRGALQAFPILFFLGLLASSIFANGSFVSFVGQDSQEYTSVLTTLAMLGLFFLIVNDTGEEKHKRVVGALVASATLIAVQLVLQVFGVSFVNLLGGSRINNTIGTINAAMVFLIVVTVLANGLWLTAEHAGGLTFHGWAKKLMSTCTIALSVSTLLLLIALDYWALWVALLIGLTMLMSLAITRAEEFTNTRRFVLPMGMTVIALLLLFLPTPLRLALPLEVTPSQGASWHIATSTLNDSSVAFGTGPGTYVNDYTKFRPSALNATSFWSVRFDRATSHILTLLPTIGVVGTALFLLFLLALGARALQALVRERQHAEWKSIFILFAAWISLSVSLFLYSANITTLFLFWLLSALLARHLLPKTKTLSFASSPRAGLASSFLFVLVAVGIVTGLFVTSQRYAAEIAFAQGVALDRAGADLDPIIAKLNTAATYNRLSDIYYRNLSQALLLKVEQELASEVTPEKAQALLQLTAQSINAAKRATALAPNNMANWSVLGALYQQVAAIDQKAEAFTLDAFAKAAELDPQNPTHPTDTGKSYLAFVQNAKTKATNAKTTVDQTLVNGYLGKAEVALNQAIALKTDYAPAHYSLAAVYEQQGRLADAISKMESIKQSNPLDVGIAFQLGMLYLRQGKNDKAEAELTRAIQLEPNFANAHWFLAAIYEQKGDVTKAIEQVSAVLASNPDNALVKAKLDRLNAGQISTVIPEPVESGAQSATSVDNTTAQQ